MLISTFESALTSGPKSAEELHAFVEEVWPHAGISRSLVDQALATAETANLIARTTELLGSGWTLTRSGQEALVGPTAWAREALGRANREMKSLAAEGDLSVSDGEADAMVAILVRALSAGIQAAASATSGDVFQLSQTVLQPLAIDQQRIDGAIQSLVPAGARQEFLLSGARAAVDPTEEFGTELVTHVTGAYVLHAFLARYDYFGDQARSIAGQRAVLDTPVLLLFLGTEAEVEAIERLVIEAVAAGFEVMVTDHTLGELWELIDRGTAIISEVESTLDAAGDSFVVRHMLDERAIELWLVGKDGRRWDTWSDFVDEVKRLEARLTELGVRRREHQNTDREAVERWREQLQKEVERRGTGRGERPIARDAETMAMVHRRREQWRISSTKSEWPGAFIISTDTHMTPAYSRAHPEDSFPLCIAASKWAALVATARRHSVVGLARSTAVLLTHEAVIDVAMRYPPDVVFELARTMSSGSFSPIELASLGRRMDELLDQGVDLTGDPKEVAVAIASVVVNLRSRRLADAAGAHTQRSTDEARRERAGREAAETQVRALQDSIAPSTSPKAPPSRTVIIAMAVTALITSGVMLIILSDLRGLSLGLLGSGVWVLLQSHDWRTKAETSWQSLLASAIPTVVGFFVDLAGR